MHKYFRYIDSQNTIITMDISSKRYSSAMLAIIFIFLSKFDMRVIGRMREMNPEFKMICESTWDTDTLNIMKERIMSWFIDRQITYRLTLLLKFRYCTNILDLHRYFGCIGGLIHDNHHRYLTWDIFIGCVNNIFQFSLKIWYESNGNGLDVRNGPWAQNLILVANAW